MSNPKKCFQIMSDEDIKDYFIRDLFFIQNIMLPICSERVGKRIDKIDIIFDLNEVNFLTFFDSNVKKLIGMTSQISQDFFPEGLNKALIINASLFFSGVWSIIKAFLDKETLNRFGLYKKDYQKYIDQLMEKEQQPQFFGGQDSTPLQEQPGPWKEEIHWATDHHSLEMRSNKYFYKYFLTQKEQAEWIAQGIYTPEENLKQNI